MPTQHPKGKSFEISKHAMKEDNLHNEDDSDDESDLNISLDLDEDDEINSSLPKKKNSAMSPSSQSQMNLISILQGDSVSNALLQVVLLKSVYKGRPSTVYFPYHKSC